VCAFCRIVEIRPHPKLFSVLFNSLKIKYLAIGVTPAFIHIAATAAEAKRHVAHQLSTQSKPNPEKPHSHVAHMDAQHRLDGRAFSRARCNLRDDLRWMLQHSLTFSFAHVSTQ
jgi:hypothetical protein